MTRLRLLLVILVAASARAGAQFCPMGLTHQKIVSCWANKTMAQCQQYAQRVGCRIVRVLPLIHAVVIEVPDSRVAAADAKLTATPGVVRIDEDKKVRWLQTLPDGFSANAPTSDLSGIAARMRALQLAAPALDPRVPWGVARVGAPLEWAKSQGDGAAIAVIDTGIDATHPDLQGQVAGGVNVVDPAHPDNWADDEGHGTHVSGTIAANGGGLFGVAPKAKLYAIKVLDKDGNGDYSSVIAGIQWAMDHGIKIANMSLGAAEGSDPLHRAVIAAQQAGMTIIAASGNTGGAVGYPGAYPEVIAVGASDKNDQVAPFSSRGPQVAFIAPGVDVVSAKMGGGYTTMSGTSMATPHIAGLAALAYSLGAHDPAALRAALTRAAKPLNGLTPDLEGSGLVLAGDLGPASLNGQGAQGVLAAMNVGAAASPR
jgi:subtilisin